MASSPTGSGRTKYTCIASGAEGAVLPQRAQRSQRPSHYFEPRNTRKTRKVNHGGEHGPGAALMRFRRPSDRMGEGVRALPTRVRCVQTKMRTVKSKLRAL